MGWPVNWAWEGYSRQRKPPETKPRGTQYLVLGTGLSKGNTGQRKQSKCQQEAEKRGNQLKAE